MTKKTPSPQNFTVKSAGCAPHVELTYCDIISHYSLAGDCSLASYWLCPATHLILQGIERTENARPPPRETGDGPWRCRAKECAVGLESQREFAARTLLLNLILCVYLVRVVTVERPREVIGEPFH